jgi:carbonic anhydrase
MSIIDKALEANRNYARNYDPTLGKHPAPKIVVVTCMDPRLSQTSLESWVCRRPISTLSEPAGPR